MVKKDALFFSFVPGSKLPLLGMVIQPLVWNPYNGYINPYYWVDDHPLLYGNNGSLDPSTFHNFNTKNSASPKIVVSTNGEKIGDT